ncbi:MAG: sugar phosphate isomerase/epimerase [Provencibacterium sp.]|jgi:sugar phosphate isomerase/epimerase|nr:sugar phosphate isomerase/epimerase [Provencibacterium sp.]
MFRLGVITDEISQDLDTALKLAREFSLDGVEIRSVWERGPFELTEQEGSAIAEKVRKAGMEVCAISAPFFKCSLEDEEEVSAHLRGLERCIRLADQLGTRLIRGFPFWDSGRLADRLPLIAERFSQPARMLEKAGMTLLLESDPSVHACNGEQLAQVLKAVDCPQIQALWDPGNDIYAPVPERPFPDGYRALRPYIRHVHLKDAVKGPDGQAAGCRFGEGLVDFKGQLLALQEDGYEGWLVMETHYRLQSSLSKEILERPGGSAFSENGYEPTRQCLISLQRMLREEIYAG